MIRAGFATGVAAAIFLIPLSSSAYVRSTAKDSPNPCLYWEVRALSFVLNAAGSQSAGTAESLAAARRSFQTWTEPPCTDITFQDLGVTADYQVGHDQRNLVVWRERLCSSVAAGNDCLKTGGCNNLFNCWEDDARTIALTTVLYDKRTGRIVDADIELNGTSNVFTAFDGSPCLSAPLAGTKPTCVATDVQNTLTHEIGHVLGLDHSPVAGSTMELSAALGETSKRTLAADDTKGLCDIYPRGQATWTCVPQESTSQGCGCGPSGGALPVSLVGPMAAAAALRRRSRR